MHPAVALAIANAARGFGEGLGTRLGEAMFGSSSGDLAELKRRLDEILRELRALTTRVDYLISLVEVLPEAIMLDSRRLSAAESREYLRSTRDLVLDTQSDSSPVPVDHIQLLTEWRVMLEMEDQPDQLMLLPYWTEIVRGVLGENALRVIRDALVGKATRLRLACRDYQTELDSIFTTAESWLSPPYFAAPKLQDVNPYLLWTKEPVPTRAVNVCRSGSNSREGFGADICSVEHHRDHEWATRQDQLIKRLMDARARIAPPMDKMKAITPPLLLLESYIEELPEPPASGFPNDFEPIPGVVFDRRPVYSTTLNLFAAESLSK